MQYKPTYTVQKQHGRILLLRKLEPFERHYYKTTDYVFDGNYFWLILGTYFNTLEAKGILQILKRNSNIT